LYLNPDLCRFLYCMINVSSISLTNVLSILDTFNTGVTKTRPKVMIENIWGSNVAEIF